MPVRVLKNSDRPNVRSALSTHLKNTTNSPFCLDIIVNVYNNVKGLQIAVKDVSLLSPGHEHDHKGHCRQA